MTLTHATYATSVLCQYDAVVLYWTYSIINMTRRPTKGCSGPVSVDWREPRLINYQHNAQCLREGFNFNQWYIMQRRSERFELNCLVFACPILIVFPLKYEASQIIYHMVYFINDTRKTKKPWWLIWYMVGLLFIVSIIV